MTEIPVGVHAERAFTVSEIDTAHSMESGDVPRLATPRAVAWAEMTACSAIGDYLDSSDTTVGVQVRVEHLAATRVGETVLATAEVTAVQGRRIDFDVLITNPDGAVALQGSVQRIRVDRERFLAG
jgi:fluoroacetyl-CoA thioesterase